MQFHLLRAAWVLPITAPPIRDGAVVIDPANGRIRDLGPVLETARRHPAAREQDLGAAILLPGLVNAHTHLSLTTLAGEIPGSGGLHDWLGAVADRARTLDTEAVRNAVREGATESRRLGTAAVGEITTRPEGWEVLAETPDLDARIFFEFLGVQEPRARERFEAAVAAASAMGRQLQPGLLPGLSPHAPYSVRPEYWAPMVSACRERDLRWSCHLAESAAEREFLTRGTGPLRRFLEGMGVWDGTFTTPGTGAVATWMENDLLDDRALLVHGVHLEPAEQAAIAASGATLCLCPRSNAYLDLPPPPVRALVEAGVPLALGTDSKASNQDLGVWGEMRAIRELMPDLPADRILEAATVNGARALGLDHRVGAVRSGLVPRLVWVPISGSIPEDPAEVLVREPVEPRLRTTF